MDKETIRENTNCFSGTIMTVCNINVVVMFCDFYMFLVKYRQFYNNYEITRN
jgi:hypothetical protein